MASFTYTPIITNIPSLAGYEMAVEIVKKPKPPAKTGGVLDMLPKQPFEPETTLTIQTHAYTEVPKETATAVPVSDYAPTNVKFGTFGGSIKEGATIKLRDATKLYQPVRGTTGGSRYFLMGANEDLRVAARYKGNTLSVRVEGPKLQDYMSVLQDIGFGKAGDDYVSIHVVCPTDMLAAKALGAILLGIGVPMLTPFPDLKVITGQGS